MPGTSSRSRGDARRRYVSPRRDEAAAATRRRVLEAAQGLFAERGWAGTGMRDVAREAGVAVETVYSKFSSKTELLLTSLGVAIVGDDLPIPLDERSEFADLGRGALADRARAAARLVREVHERTAGLQQALREAAASDPDLSERRSEGDERRRVNVEEGARLVAGRAVTGTERDGLWALLSMEVYELLVERSAWSASRYEDWVASAIVRVLGPDTEESP